MVINNEFGECHVLSSGEPARQEPLFVDWSHLAYAKRA